MLGLKPCCGDFHDSMLFLVPLLNRLDYKLLILLTISQICILGDKAIELVTPFITFSHGVGGTVMVVFHMPLIARLRGGR